MDAKDVKMHGFDYVFDEEAGGFGEPYKAPAAAAGHGGVSGAERAGLALVVVGLAYLVYALVTGEALGGWMALLMSFGLPAVGGTLYFVAHYRRQPAGIRNDGTFFRGLTAAGLAGWIAGLLLTAFYVAIYWFPDVLGEHADVWANGQIVKQAYNDGLVLLAQPLAQFLTHGDADKWFVYGLLYT